MFKTFQNIVIFLFVAILTVSCGSEDDENSTLKPNKINANSLMDKFESNTEKANLKYLGKALEVKGTITEISTNSLGFPVFTLKTKSKHQAQVMCTMLADNLKYEPGSEVSIKGFCIEYKFNVFLENCVTVD